MERKNSEMRRVRFKQVDVFTRVPFDGNPVAVVLDGAALDDGAMQDIAAWTNLSETTFVLPPEQAGADYRLRIFTPRRELPFAGHPTVGSAHAILEAGVIQPGNGRLLQECGAGLVELEILNGTGEPRIMVNSPTPAITSPDRLVPEQLQQAMGTTFAPQARPLLVDVGPRWLVVEFATREQVQSLMPDLPLLGALSKYHGITGITAFGFSDDAGCPVYVRSFAPVEGVPEDPVCGSGNISVGAYLLRRGLQEKTGTSYIANQGRELGRNGYVYVTLDPDTGAVKIGGHALTCIDGELFC